MCEQFQNISSLTDISTPLKFLKGFKNQCLSESFYLKDPTQKTDFGTSHGRTVFHLLKKPVGNQCLKVLRILVPPEILVPLEISA